MKFALIGDPHFANRKMFGVPSCVPGVNTRLQAVTRTMKWIASDIDRRLVNTQVVILGDITHDHGRLTPPVLQQVNETLGWFRNVCNLDVTLMTGNHDLDPNGLSIVPAFEREGVTVVTQPEPFTETDTGYEIHIIPYCSADEAMAYMDSIKGKAAMLLMHHSFEGAKHGTHEFQPPGGIPPALVPDYFQVYSGHYHMRQSLKPTLTYTGAPLQHDFGESNYVPGYVLLDLDRDPHEYEFVEVPAEVAPRFHILPHNLELQDLPGLTKSDYYRIDLPTDVDPKEIVDLQKALTNVIIKPIPIDSCTRSRVEEYLKDKGKKVDFFDVMAAYAAMHIDEDDRADRIYELGKSIATKVIGE